MEPRQGQDCDHGPSTRRWQNVNTMTKACVRLKLHVKMEPLSVVVVRRWQSVLQPQVGTGRSEGVPQSATATKQPCSFPQSTTHKLQLPSPVTLGAESPHAEVMHYFLSLFYHGHNGNCISKTFADKMSDTILGIKRLVMSAGEGFGRDCLLLLPRSNTLAAHILLHTHLS